MSSMMGFTVGFISCLSGSENEEMYHIIVSVQFQLFAEFDCGKLIIS